MKYKRKSLVVEAVKWMGERDLLNEPVWLADAFEDGIIRI